MTHEVSQGPDELCGKARGMLVGGSADPTRVPLDRAGGGACLVMATLGMLEENGIFLGLQPFLFDS